MHSNEGLRKFRRTAPRGTNVKRASARAVLRGMQDPHLVCGGEVQLATGADSHLVRAFGATTLQELGVRVAASGETDLIDQQNIAS